MRFALHLLAALLLIEEDAGCHEDGTADDERLADEFRAGLKPTKSTRWTSSTHTSDETREYSRRNRAKTRSDSSSVVSSRCPNLCLLIPHGVYSKS